MKPILSFFLSSGAVFARVVSGQRDLTISVEAQDEMAVRAEANALRERAARLIERANFIESAFAPAGDSATPWVAVPHPMLAGVFAVKRTVTLTDGSQRAEYVGPLGKPATAEQAVNFAFRPNAVTKASWMNAEASTGTVRYSIAKRRDVADVVEFKTLCAA